MRRTELRLACGPCLSSWVMCESECQKGRKVTLALLGALSELASWPPLVGDLELPDFLYPAPSKSIRTTDTIYAMV